MAQGDDEVYETAGPAEPAVSTICVAMGFKDPANSACLGTMAPMGILPLRKAAPSQ